MVGVLLLKSGGAVRLAVLAPTLSLSALQFTTVLFGLISGSACVPFHLIKDVVAY